MLVTTLDPEEIVIYQSGSKRDISTFPNFLPPQNSQYMKPQLKQNRWTESESGCAIANDQRNLRNFRPLFINNYLRSYSMAFPRHRVNQETIARTFNNRRPEASRTKVDWTETAMEEHLRKQIRLFGLVDVILGVLG
jgi:hypothetical protein